jgi:hypothetical protein
MKVKKTDKLAKKCMDRRSFLASSGMAGTLVTLSPFSMLAGNNNEKNQFADLLETLRKHLVSSFEQSKVLFDNDLLLHSPCVSETYRGIWPDDFLYPLIMKGGLYEQEELDRIAQFLTSSIVDLQYFPDRIEADGMPVMLPGGLNHPHASKMPIHLPAAWIRLIDNLEKWGANIPRKMDWAKIFKRSIDDVSFSCGLAYVDPQQPRVGFGFHDPEAITGFELMSSLVLHFGLKRAVRLFKGHIDESEIIKWTRLSEGISNNLYRLYDKEQGAFFAGSKDCRQINVWGNGLAYWLVEPDKQKTIAEYYYKNREAIFMKGFTRQIAEPEGWQRHFFPSTVGSYTNGGFWTVGTGWVLPAIADQNPGFALEIAEELVANLVKYEFREYINADGTGGGATGFLAAIAVPMMGLTAIIDNRPFSDFF